MRGAQRSAVTSLFVASARHLSNASLSPPRPPSRPWRAQACSSHSLSSWRPRCSPSSRSPAQQRARPTTDVCIAQHANQRPSDATRRIPRDSPTTGGGGGAGTGGAGGGAECRGNCPGTNIGGGSGGAGAGGTGGGATSSGGTPSGCVLALARRALTRAGGSMLLRHSAERARSCAQADHRRRRRCRHRRWRRLRRLPRQLPQLDRDRRRRRRRRRRRWRRRNVQRRRCLRVRPSRCVLRAHLRRRPFARGSSR